LSRCKYVQTDAAGDELVQLQIIHTLSNIIKSPVSGYLTDTTAWDIINASHSILTHIAITGTETHYLRVHILDLSVTIKCGYS
jgi:hypothetical protein